MYGCGTVWSARVLFHLSRNNLMKLSPWIWDKMHGRGTVSTPRVPFHLSRNYLMKLSFLFARQSTELWLWDKTASELFELPESPFISAEIISWNSPFNWLGNPLNCDCETKWLRNWVSSQRESYYANDEPRCYFPKSLSGNPLRQLRSSRWAGILAVVFAKVVTIKILLILRRHP
jgi:hypothetical protein